MLPSLRESYAPPLVEFLRTLGADRVRHSGRAFLEHLIGTARLLEAWGADDDVCKAGLFHSVYGTEFFREAVVSLSDRALVRERLGARAERLAYLFCAFDRRSLFAAIGRGEPYAVDLRADGERIGISPRELIDLVAIIWSNALEQLDPKRQSADVRTRSWRAIETCRPFLPAAAWHDLHAAYGPAASSLTMKPGLGTLFGLDDPATFLTEHWPDRMRVSRGPVERLAGLVDYDFDALVAMEKRTTKAFYRTAAGQDASLIVTKGQERALYEAGFTIYFHSLKGPNLEPWIDTLDRELGLVRGATRVSAFASRRGLGLQPHYDLNDNIVCQAAGMKRWRIAPNTHVRHPTVGYTVGHTPNAKQAAEAPNGFPDSLPTPFETVELDPGTVMFIPRGMWHDTETIDSASLHFNVQCGLATWKDVLEFVLLGTTALHDESLREPVQELLGGDGRAFPARLREKLSHLVKGLSDGDLDIDRDALYRFVAQRRSA